MNITKMSDTVFVCGMTSFLPTDEVLAAIAAAGVRVVLCMTLVPDRRLAAAAPAAGFEYRHVPLKSGAPPFAAARMVKAVKDAAESGVVLLVGETDNGPALRLARSAVTGNKLPRRGRMYGG